MCHTLDGEVIAEQQEMKCFTQETNTPPGPWTIAIVGAALFPRFLGSNMLKNIRDYKLGPRNPI